MKLPGSILKTISSFSVNSTKPLISKLTTGLELIFKAKILGNFFDQPVRFTSLILLFLKEATCNLDASGNLSKDGSLVKPHPSAVKFVKFLKLLKSGNSPNGKLLKSNFSTSGFKNSTNEIPLTLDNNHFKYLLLFNGPLSKEAFCFILSTPSLYTSGEITDSTEPPNLFK